MSLCLLNLDIGVETQSFIDGVGIDVNRIPPWLESTISNVGGSTLRTREEELELIIESNGHELLSSTSVVLLSCQQTL